MTILHQTYVEAEDTGYFELILNHRSVRDGYFHEPFRTTGLENQDDPTANTYSIIGKLNMTMRQKYKGEDNKYLFKLIWRYDSRPDYVIIWKQSSWLTEKIIIGADLFGVPEQDALPATNANATFHGLGLNNNSYGFGSGSSYLDGDGSSSLFWYVDYAPIFSISHTNWYQTYIFKVECGGCDQQHS